MRIGVPLAVIPEELLARLDLPGRPREARIGSRVCGKSMRVRGTCYSYVLTPYVLTREERMGKQVETETKTLACRYT